MGKRDFECQKHVKTKVWEEFKSTFTRHFQTIKILTQGTKSPIIFEFKGPLQINKCRMRL